MKTIIELNENDIKAAIAEWYYKNHGRTIAAKNIELKVTPADDDPRAPTPERVSASMFYEQS
ncbi:MAG: hypothetical protein EOP83_09605 [Verrucomicrobiaceae bacterium]|nr:MAG: hypothetical protein EOP83_09605 [Verrucomicrobiaceae bacterium]